MMWITIITLAITSALFAYIAYRKVILIDEMNVIIQRYDDRQIATRQSLIDLVEIMKVVDLNGSFESDDEVGITFKQLQELISDYNIIINDEERAEE